VPSTENPAPQRDPYRASLRASRERRLVALRRRKRRLRGRTGAIVALLSLSVMAGGAVAATPTAGTGADTLQRGTTGNATSAVQSALGIPADGIYGPQTTAAVKRFQREHGLTVDGIAGPATLSALGLSGASTSTAAPTSATSATTATAPTAQAALDTDAAAAPSGGLLARIARCESGGDPTAVSASGTYRGKYQFRRATWRAMGGSGDPAQAPEAEQDQRAALLLRSQGRSAWPVCAS
jgi:hypothetical protein